MTRYRLMDIKKDWPEVAKFVGPILCADTCGIIAENSKGELEACGVFDSFTVCACNVHLGIKNPFVLRHGFLPLLADYLFNYRNRSRIFGLTPENNLRARKFNEHIGFEVVTILPDAYADGVGYVITKMERKGCRWLPQTEEVA